MTREMAEKCLVNRRIVFYTDNDGESKKVLITAVTSEEVLITFLDVFENRWVGLNEVEE